MSRPQDPEGGPRLSQPHVGVLMFVSHRSIEQRVLARLRESGYEITAAQGRVFARIGPDGTRLTELADSAQVTKQTAGFLVDQLVRGGYVERVPDPSDARARLVRMLPRGRLVQERAREVEDEVTAEWTRHLGEPAMATLTQTMGRLREITDPYA
ncbi:MAG: MarR family transcriptional regulator [Friedmanniella sp.]|nr:MarR family transcriptional regulator [Friedmanniella sp.]